jgi:O-methyltransferase involved in polyketide biosynthesis
MKVNNKEQITTLEGVPKTLLLPLFGRAKYTLEGSPLIKDEKAVEIAQRLDFDFEKLSEQIGENAGIWWAVRAYQIDKALNQFLKENPKATVVNLGAGLDTSFYRHDNGLLKWIDIDLPEVIDLRKQLLPEEDRVIQVAKSALDYSWIDLLTDAKDGVFIIAGGLLFYFLPDEVKGLLVELAERCPGAQIIFDVISPKGLEQANKLVASAGMASARLQWGVRSAAEITAWSSKIQVVSAKPYFYGVVMRFKLPLKFYFVVFKNLFFKDASMYHLKFD